MLLDTNVYQAFLRKDSRLVEPLKQSTTMTFPLAALAELRKGFLGGTRLAENERRLEQFMLQGEVGVALPTKQTAEYFAELWVFCHSKGRALSDNDLWIAATALETGEMLLTLDKDFVVFSDYPGLSVIVL
ncbi:PIN domain-containing protein [Candidatus Saccharibacteria bacterium]|nr:PIN domain-containing protein [Candidatus Saccharibacteria bacterium]